MTERAWPDDGLRAMPASNLHDRYHRYRWPDVAPFEMENVVSVTTVKGGGIPAPALPYWYAKMVAERAVDHVEKISDWVENEEYGEAINFLKAAPNAARDTKADMGTIVHMALEAYVSGVDNEESLDEALESRNKRLTAKQIKHAHGYYRAGLQFAQDWQPNVRYTEAAVFSRKHGYAGTADMIGTISIPSEGDDLPAILDYKTGKAVYNEMALQLVAYARGDFIGMEDGTEMPLAELPEINHGVIVRLMPSGKYQAVPFRFTPELFDLFLHVKEVAARDTILDASRMRDLPRRELVDKAKPKRRTPTRKPKEA